LFGKQGKPATHSRAALNPAQSRKAVAQQGTLHSPPTPTGQMQKGNVMGRCEFEHDQYEGHEDEFSWYCDHIEKNWQPKKVGAGFWPRYKAGGPNHPQA